MIRNFQLEIFPFYQANIHLFIIKTKAKTKNQKI